MLVPCPRQPSPAVMCIEEGIRRVRCGLLHVQKRGKVTCPQRCLTRACHTVAPALLVSSLAESSLMWLHATLTAACLAQYIGGPLCLEFVLHAWVCLQRQAEKHWLTVTKGAHQTFVDMLFMQHRLMSSAHQSS